MASLYCPCSFIRVALCFLTWVMTLSLAMQRSWRALMWTKAWKREGRRRQSSKKEIKPNWYSKSKHTLVISKRADTPKSSVSTKSQGSRSIGFTKEPTSPTTYSLWVMRQHRPSRMGPEEVITPLLAPWLGLRDDFPFGEALLGVTTVFLDRRSSSSSVFLRDGKMYPIRGYPARPDPNGSGFIRPV